MILLFGFLNWSWNFRCARYRRLSVAQLVSMIWDALFVPIVHIVLLDILLWSSWLMWSIFNLRIDLLLFKTFLKLFLAMLFVHLRLLLHYFMFFQALLSLLFIVACDTLMVIWCVKGVHDLSHFTRTLYFSFKLLYQAVATSWTMNINHCFWRSTRSIEVLSVKFSIHGWFSIFSSQLGRILNHLTIEFFQILELMKEPDYLFTGCHIKSIHGHFWRKRASRTQHRLILLWVCW